MCDIEARSPTLPWIETREPSIGGSSGANSNKSPGNGSPAPPASAFARASFICCSNAMRIAGRSDINDDSIAA